MKNFLTNQGPIHQTTFLDTSQQNGVTERRNRTLLEKSWAIMIESKVLANFYPKAIIIVNYLTNCLLHKSLNHKTPLVSLSTLTEIHSCHSLPLRNFGCVVYVHPPKRCHNKLEPRAVRLCRLRDHLKRVSML